MNDDDEIQSLRKLSDTYLRHCIGAWLAGFLLMALLDRFGTAGSRWAGILAMVSFVLLWIYALFAWVCLLRVRLRIRAIRRGNG